jgi:predicted  nucleic acid-binding Zn-ribbon protein
MTNMKLKKLKKKIQELEKRLREGSQRLAKLRRRLQEAESAKALKAARKSAARASTNRKGAKPSASPAPTADAKKPKKKLNLSPERRAQLAAAMKARWAAKRASEGGNTTSTDKNSPTPPTQPPENRPDGV